MEKDKRTLWERIRSWGQNVHYQYWKVCSMRNSFVNVVLAIALSLAIVASLMVLACTVSMMIAVINMDGWAFGITGIFYSLFCIYFMSRFIGGNEKQAIFPAFIGSVFVWYPMVLFYIFTMNPSIGIFDDNYDSWYSDLVFMIVPFIQSILLNIIYFILIWITMRIKKDGISAWNLLQDTHSERSKFEKTCIVIACLIWLIPVIICMFPY
ncbi:MAG: hypothetical protein K2H22_02405 [Muribaculaceae bacterium]|nr:hypothetical protein [Muribaculaceae bacterium]